MFVLNNDASQKPLQWLNFTCGYVKEKSSRDSHDRGIAWGSEMPLPKKNKDLILIGKGSRYHVLVLYTYSYVDNT